MRMVSSALNAQTPLIIRSDFANNKQPGTNVGVLNMICVMYFVQRNLKAR